MGLSLTGLPGYGRSAWTPISAWETFPSRIVVLLSGADLSLLSSCKYFPKAF